MSVSNNSYSHSSPEPIKILLVEDNPGDVRLLKEAFDATKREMNLHTVPTGDAAMEFLTQCRTEPSRSLPALIFVDLNLPGADGCDVLETIRNDPNLPYLPVIMLSSSDDHEEIRRCYNATANAYLTKPRDHDRFVSLVEAVEAFWFEHVHFPERPQ
ncbi:response regulator [Natrinema sp. 1APR25-10V2]|uniref:response regulator n=1 Tax=Natrinema sp. 1APR25-10V2 TaxID=2951081 RepID=UPI0028756A98|nr:response regulator [Natrinema sp. 1APR25-10V2]MDS0474666.1 response regulator [Natrinema sp. 1APR25-10V2]